MINDTGCCGFHLQENSITFLGLMTFSLPVVILSVLLSMILLVFGTISSHIRKLNKRIVLILKANLNLIQTVPLYPKARCRVAGKIFSFSPRVSGFMYKNFNMGLLVSVWLIIAFFIRLIGVLIVRG